MKKIVIALVFLSLCLCAYVPFLLTSDDALKGGLPFNTAPGTGDTDDLNNSMADGDADYSKVGGACSGQVNSYRDDIPVHGWPVNFRNADWTTISAWFCDPTYRDKFGTWHPHWGIDVASRWIKDPYNEVAAAKLNINGAEVVSTADFALIRKAVADGLGNHCKGNFIKMEPLIALTPDELEDNCPTEPTPEVTPGSTPIPAGTPTNTPECKKKKPKSNPDYEDKGGKYYQDADHPDPAVWYKESGWTVWYFHLTDTVVQPDALVHRGDVLGHVGNTGCSTGPHLHYEIAVPFIDGVQGGVIDPAVTMPNYAPEMRGMYTPEIYEKYGPWDIEFPWGAVKPTTQS